MSSGTFSVPPYIPFVLQDLSWHKCELFSCVPQGSEVLFIFFQLITSLLFRLGNLYCFVLKFTDYFFCLFHSVLETIKLFIAATVSLKKLNVIIVWPSNSTSVYICNTHTHYMYIVLSSKNFCSSVS